MVWVYAQSTGELTHDGAYEGLGYSGTGIGRNNTQLERVAGHGPIPRGKYKIGPAYDHPHLGPCVMNLDAEPDTQTFGRDLFRIHGNNKANDASHGCVILGPAIRHAIAASGDTELNVI